MMFTCFHVACCPQQAMRLLMEVLRQPHKAQTTASRQFRLELVESVPHPLNPKLLRCAPPQMPGRASSVQLSKVDGNSPSEGLLMKSSYVSDMKCKRAHSSHSRLDHGQPPDALHTLYKRRSPALKTSHQFLHAAMDPE